MRKYRKTTKDIQLDKIKFVRVTSEKAKRSNSHLFKLDVGVRYELTEKKALLKPNGKTIAAFDVRNLIHKKALTVICL